MLQLTQLLLHHGADVNALSTSGWTPMHNAVMSYCQCPLYSGSSISLNNNNNNNNNSAAAGGSSSSGGEAQQQQQQQQQQAEPKQREHLAVIQLLAHAFASKNPDVELLPPEHPGQHFDVDMQALLRVAMQQARAAQGSAAPAAIGNGFAGISGSSGSGVQQQQQQQQQPYASNGLQKVEMLQRAHEEMRGDGSDSMAVDVRAV
jgi:Ankyrin repeats (many copies)